MTVGQSMLLLKYSSAHPPLNIYFSTAYFFDSDTLTHFTHAVRPIHEGEEITLSCMFPRFLVAIANLYFIFIDTDQMAEFNVRQSAIETSWGFRCTCSLCSLPEPYVDASDRRLAMISKITDKIIDFPSGEYVPPEMGETLVSLFHQERLESNLADAYKHAALAYAAVGQEWLAIKYAALTVEYGQLISGPNDPEVVEMKVFLEDPKKHWTWKKRVIADKSDN